MNRTSERQVVETTRAALDRLAGSIDAESERDLDAARRRALRGTARASSPGWMWAAAAAAVLALALGIGLVDRNGGERSPLTEQLVADAELYQDMEFYLWLSEELESD